MINEDLIIKKRAGTAPLYSLLSLIMMAASILCLMLPAFKDYDQIRTTVYIAVGVVGTAYFAFSAAYMLFNAVSPAVSLVISHDGIYDYSYSKGYAFISWDNIEQIKLYGRTKSEYLGIAVKTPSKVFKGLNQKEKNEIRGNMSAGMPAVVIKGKLIEIDLEDLISELTARHNEFKECDKTKVLNKAEADEIIAAQNSMRREGSPSLVDSDEFEKNIKNENNEIKQPKIAEKSAVSKASVKKANPLNTGLASEQSIDDILNAISDIYKPKTKPAENANNEQPAFSVPVENPENQASAEKEEAQLKLPIDELPFNEIVKSHSDNEPENDNTKNQTEQNEADNYDILFVDDE